MSGFESPNFTQTPNDLFDTLMREMDLAELKVVLAVIRYTFGWHREEFQMSVRKMAELTGMSAASVQTGAKAAEERGLIERVVDGQNSTYWKAVVGVPDNSTVVYQNLVHPVPESDIQLGLNKDKEIKRKEKKEDTPPDTEGITYFLKALGAKRLNTVQFRKLATLEKTHGTDKLKEMIDWCATNSMNIGRAITSMETAAPGWGQAKKRTNGNKPAQQQVDDEWEAAFERARKNG
jgi:phage replication O-like protein O